MQEYSLDTDNVVLYDGMNKSIGNAKVWICLYQRCHANLRGMVFVDTVKNIFPTITTLFYSISPISHRVRISGLLHKQQMFRLWQCSTCDYFNRYWHEAYFDNILSRYHNGDVINRLTAIDMNRMQYHHYSSDKFPLNGNNYAGFPNMP